MPAEACIQGASSGFSSFARKRNIACLGHELTRAVRQKDDCKGQPPEARNGLPFMLPKHGTQSGSSTATDSCLEACDFRALFDASAHPLVLLDPGATILDVNAAYVRESMRP